MGTVRNARVNQGGPKCAGIVGLGLIGFTGWRNHVKRRAERVERE